MRLVIRDKIRQLMKIDFPGTPVVSTREKPWRNI